MKRDTPRGSAITNVMRSDSLVSVGKEYLELGLDAALESGLFKDIPLVSTVVGLFGTIGSVRDQLLATKLLRFFDQLSEIPQEERIEMVDKLNEDDKFSGKAGAAVLEVIDRMESQKKPELAAKCFAAYARAEISFEELRRLLFALERIPSFDIEKLAAFSTVAIEDSLKMDESLLLAFVNAGLGKNNGGFGGGAIVPTNLCQTFVRLGLTSLP
jgi:hypothetical protein